MSTLTRQLNKHNGNICFYTESNSGAYIFECDRQTRTLTYATSLHHVTSICQENDSAYLFAYNSSFIGQYENNIIDNAYVNTVFSNITLLTSGENGEYYAFDTNTSSIIKFTIPYAVDWQINLSLNPIECLSLQYRESDKTIVISDSQKLIVVRDDTTQAIVLSELDLKNILYSQFTTGDIYLPETCFMRYRTVSGTLLDRSSSSSSSSEGYSSSSSFIDDDCNKFYEPLGSPSYGQRFGTSVETNNKISIIHDDGLEKLYLYRKNISGTWQYLNNISFPNLGAGGGSFIGSGLQLLGQRMILGLKGPSHTEYWRGGGIVYRQTSNPSIWVMESLLFPPGNVIKDSDGGRTSMNNAFAFVGDPSDDDNGSNSGAVFVYQRYENNWTYKQKLTAFDAASGDNFGYSTSVFGNYAIISAIKEDSADTDAGAIYIYRLTGDVWTYSQKITASDASSSDYFGMGIKMSQGRAIIGSANDKVYILSENAGVWSEEKIISYSASGSFGREAIDIDQTNIVIGSYLDNSGAGSAHLYKYINGDWHKQGIIEDSNTILMGTCVAIRENTAIVGSPYDSTRDTWDGASYICTLSDINFSSSSSSSLDSSSSSSYQYSSSSSSSG